MQKDLEVSKHSVVEELDCTKMKQETLISSLQRLQEDFEKLSEQHQLQAKAVKADKEEYVQLQKKFQDLTSERQDMSDRLKDQAQQLGALKGHIKDLNASYQEKDETLKSISKENANLRNELSATKISLDLFKSQQVDNEKFVNLSQELDLLKAEQTKLLAYCKELENNKITSGKQIATYDEKIKQLQENLCSSCEKVQHLEDSLSREKSDFEARAKGYAAKLEEQQLLVSSLQQEKNMLANSLSEMTSSKTVLNGELSDAKRKLENCFEEHGETVRNKDKEICDLSGQLSDVKNQLKSTAEKQSEVLATLNASEAAKLSLQSRVDQLEQENLELKKADGNQVDHASEVSALMENALQLLLTKVGSEMSRLKATTCCADSFENDEHVKASFAQSGENVQPFKELLSEHAEMASKISALMHNFNILTMMNDKLNGKCVALTDSVQNLSAENLNLQSQLSAEAEQTEELRSVEYDKETLKRKLTKLEEEHELLVKEKASVVSANQELVTRVSELNAQLSKLEQEHVIDAELVCSLQKQVNLHRNNEDTIDMLQKKLAASEKVISETLETFNAKSDKFSNRIEELLQQNEDLSAQVEVFAAKVNESDHVISQLRDGMQNGKNSNDVAVQSLRDEKVALENELCQTKDEFAKFRCERSAALKECASNEVELKEKIEASQRIANDLKTALQESEDKGKEKQKQIERLSEECARFEEVSKSLEEKLERMQQSKQESEKEVVEITTEMEKLKSAFASDKASVNAKLAEMQEDLRRSNSEKKSLEDEIVSLKEKLDGLARQKSDLLRSTENADGAIEEERLKVTAAEQKVDKLNFSLSELEAKLLLAEADKKTFENKVGELETDLQAARAAVEEKIKAIEYLGAKVDKLSCESRTHVEAIKAYQEQISVLTNLRDEITAGNEANLQTIAQLQERIDNLTSQHEQDLLSETERRNDLNEKLFTSVSEKDELKRLLSESSEKLEEKDELLKKTAETLKSCEINLQNAKSSNEELQMQVSFIVFLSSPNSSKFFTTYLWCCALRIGGECVYLWLQLLMSLLERLSSD